MQVIPLCLERTFMSATDGTALKVLLDRLVPELRTAKSATLVVAIHGRNLTDARVSFPYDAGPDGVRWEAFTSVPLFDSGESTGIDTGTKHPSAATDVTRFGTLRVYVQVEKTNGGAGTLKSVTLSAWLVLKPF